MRAKEISAQEREVIIRLKQNKPYAEITKTSEVAKSAIFKGRNALASSATVKGQKDHRRQLKWTIA